MSESKSMKQFSINSPLSWEGIGLHTGEKCKVSVHPAEPGFGIKLKRIDLNEEKWVPADIRFVSSTDRSTNLANGELVFGTVEHLLASLAGGSISNAEIHLEGPEVPILNGSADSFYSSLLSNRVEQDALRKEWKITETIEFTDEVSGASYTIIPHDHLELEVILDYGSQKVGRQHALFVEGDDFASFAEARTFVLSSELGALCEQGLIKGGSLENAVLIPSDSNAKDDLSKALNFLNIENSETILDQFEKGHKLKYDNELARHKLVDLLGDLTLLGHAIKAKIIARKPGHTGNAALVKHLKPILQRAIKLKGKPSYDPNKEPIYNTVEIQGFLPHRYPFLLVDKIIELSDTHVVGIKNITFNEQLFQGHFPGNPVFPGVLQMEALAQTGGILALSTRDNPSDWDTYFLKMDNVKLRKKVLPGDTLILKMELLSPIRRGIVHMQGTTYVGDQIASEGELTAQIVNRTTL